MSEITPIKMPKWGLSMTEGKVVAWLVSPGDQVKAGDELVEVETDKITNVGEASADGVIRRVVANEDDVIAVGDLLGVIAPDGVADADIDAFVSTFQSQFDPEEAAAAEQANLEVRQVDIGSGRMLRAAVASGDLTARPMVLLHGFGGDFENWALVQESLAAARPVYALELPGHGGSTKDVGAGRLDDLVSAVEAAVGELGFATPLHLGGHSLGGAVAAEVALRLGERVASLSLVCPAAMSGGSLSTDYLDGFVSARRARDLREPVSMLFHDPSIANREMLDNLLKAKRLDGAQEALTAIKDNMTGGDPAYAGLAERVQGIQAPLTVIASRTDAIVGAPSESGMPANARFHWLEGVGHMPHLEKSEDVANILSEFVALHDE